ncbi:hypothetical protein FJTKL_15307 [Diaporthe vaccinii]|uniref:Uncharacterized protein n=1 Tax=Diaporthe vaccinii TaxID=105482 RepID=A0ABR4E5B2_9PEZI
MSKARADIRALLEEHPEELADEQPSEDEEEEFNGLESEQKEEEEDENENEDGSAGRAARRAELKETAKAGLHALVELWFDDSE